MRLLKLDGWLSGLSEAAAHDEVLAVHGESKALRC